MKPLFVAAFAAIALAACGGTDTSSKDVCVTDRLGHTDCRTITTSK